MKEAYRLQNALNNHAWKLNALMMCALLGGCSIVQLSPTMNCEHITYTRDGNEAKVYAEGCKV
jgi:hypothetical protein